MESEIKVKSTTAPPPPFPHPSSISSKVAQVGILQFKPPIYIGLELLQFFSPVQIRVLFKYSKHPTFIDWVISLISYK